jgi:hypothetical protein
MLSAAARRSARVQMTTSSESIVRPHKRQRRIGFVGRSACIPPHALILPASPLHKVQKPVGGGTAIVHAAVVEPVRTNMIETSPLPGAPVVRCSSSATKQLRNAKRSGASGVAAT